MLRRPLPAGHPLRVAAARAGAPVVAVPDSVCLAADELALHRILRAIAGNTCLSRLAEADCALPDAWLAPPAAYAERFATLPQALHAAAEIATRLTFTGPRFGTVLPPLAGHDEASAVARLRAEAYAGAHGRYGGELAEAVVERLEHELALIGRMGFAAYFLIVRDIVRLSPRTCGRGSGAASLVAYCLGITNVCPLKHTLYFERFLNPGRTDPPDIDVDFAWDERDAVLAAVLARHRGHVAMVANHVLFQPRMAVREVAKVYGLSVAEIGRVSARLPGYWNADEVDADLLELLRRRPEARELDFPPPWPEILGFARRLVGTPRHLSVHPGGVVITPRPIDEYVPLERAPKGVPIIQWEKDGAEDAGLVKIDLLGNRSLGVIRDALAELREQRLRGRRVLLGARGRLRHPGDRRPGPHDGVLLHREPGHAPAAAEVAGGRLRPPGHPQQHHPAGGQRLHPRVRPPPARRRVDADPPAAERGAGGELRHHGLPGGRLARGRGLGRVLARRGRRPAQGALQEGPRAAAAGLRTTLRGRRPRPRRRRGAGRRGLGHDDELRRLLVLQAAQRLLRARLVPGGLPQDPPPRGVHGRGDQQPGRVLQRVRLRVRSPPSGADRAPAGRVREPRALVRVRRSSAGGAARDPGTRG